MTSPMRLLPFDIIVCFVKFVLSFLFLLYFVVVLPTGVINLLIQGTAELVDHSFTGTGGHSMNEDERFWYVLVHIYTVKWSDWAGTI